MSTTPSSAADTEAELANIEIRHTSPENILYIWEAIVKLSKTSPGKSVNIAKLTKCLVNHIKYETNEAKQIINTAIKDKLIILINSENGVNNKKERLKLPNKQDINKNSYDWYCYECHKPNPDGLQRCIQCLRSFHTSCWRIDLDKSNNSSVVEIPNRKEVKSFKKTASNKNGGNTNGSGPINNQSHCINENSIDTTSEQQQNAIEIDCDEESIENYDNDLDETNKSITVLSDVFEKQENNESDYQNISSVSVNNCDLKTETKDDIKLFETDCFYVRDVRPPSRKKCGNQSQSFKSETNNRNENDDETEKKLCSCCRLMNKSELSGPPNKSKEDINYLLRFSFARIKSWLPADTFSISTKSNILTIYKSHINLFSSLCFKYPKSLTVIDNKLKNNEYSSLTEFQCDFMDIQHCIGILYGVDSGEYLRTDYLMYDCLCELSEIRLCSDCYRYSHETASEDWFCKPCVPRHELVFAKQAGYRYWPAKVIRVEGNRYDVRFFGPKHTRAVIEAKYIKSIDSEIDEIKTHKLTEGFKKAMDELHKHQKMLIPLPASEVTLTTFSNDFQVMNNVNGRPNLQRCNKSRKKQQHQEQQQQQNQQLQYTQLVNQQLMNITFLPNTRGNSKRKRKSSHSKNSPIDLIYESENSNTTPVLENISLAIANKKPKILLEKTTRNRNIRKSMNTPLPDISSNSPAFTFTRKSRSKSLYEMNNRILDDETLVSSTQETDLNKEQRTEKSLNNTVEIFHKELISIKNLSVKKRIALEKFFKTELNHLQEQINELNKQHKIEISAVKRKTWCVQCEKIACLSCCRDANYCSSNCQIQHWPIHKRKCTNGDNDERSVKKFKNIKRSINGKQSITKGL